MTLSTKDLVGWLLLAACILGGLGFLLLPGLMHTPELDENLCLEGKPIGRHYIFVVDQSDPVPQRNIEQLNRIFEKTVREMGINDRISIYYLSDSATPYAKDNHSICNPGRGDDANPYVQNPQKIEAAFRDHFQKPLEHAISAESLSQQSRRSPIMEYLEDLTRVQKLLPQAESQVYYVLSDFIQNSALLNQYKESPTFDEQEARDAMVFHAPDFGGMDVHLIYIQRPEQGAVQSTNHKRFWRDYFRHFHAGRVDLM